MKPLSEKLLCKNIRNTTNRDKSGLDLLPGFVVVRCFPCVRRLYLAGKERFSKTSSGFSGALRESIEGFGKWVGL